MTARTAKLSFFGFFNQAIGSPNRKTCFYSGWKSNPTMEPTSSQWKQALEEENQKKILLFTKRQ